MPIRSAIAAPVAWIVAALIATPVLALCPSVPETAATGYSLNNVERSLCLQREIADGLAEKMNLRQYELELNALEVELQLQRLRELPYDGR